MSVQLTLRESLNPVLRFPVNQRAYSSATEALVVHMAGSSGLGYRPET